MCLKTFSNLIGICDRLLQEPVPFLRKFSRTFHESYQSNTANDNEERDQIKFTIFVEPAYSERRIVTLQFGVCVCVVHAL